MSDLLFLVEKMSPFAQWRRWWGNSVTGQILDVPAGQEHDNFLEENIEEFLTPQELEYSCPEEEVWMCLDSVLEAVYAKGWQAILYDGSEKTLMMRSNAEAGPKPMRVFAEKLSSQVAIDSIFIDSGENHHYEIEGEDVERFIKSGRLPRKRMNEAFEPNQIAFLCRKIMRQMGGDAWEINNGWCWGFANRLAELLGPEAEVVSTTEMEGVFPGHSVVLYRGRYYDVESPEGVEDPRDLAYSRRLYGIIDGPDEP